MPADKTQRTNGRAARRAGKLLAAALPEKTPTGLLSRRVPGFCQMIFERVTEDAVWQLDLDTGAVHWSSGRTRLFGYRAQEIGDTLAWWRARVHPDDLGRLREATEAGLGDGDVWSVEWRLRRRDGSYADVLTRAIRLAGPHGRPARLAGLLRDISAERQAQRDAERRLQQQAMVTELGQFVLAGGSLTQFLRRAARAIAVAVGADVCRILGPRHDPERLAVLAVGGPAAAGCAAAFGSEEIRRSSVAWEDLRVAAVVSSAARGVPAPVRRTMRRFGWKSALVARVPGAQGPWGLIEAYSASPERFPADQAVFDSAAAVVGGAVGREASEKRFRVLIEESGEGLGMLAADGTFIYNSPACERIFGYSHEELRGRSAFEFVHPDEVERVRKTIEEYLAVPGRTLHLRQRFRHKDGSWRWIESTSRNLLAEPGIGATVTSYRDVTEQVGAEEALRMSEEKWRSLVQNAPGHVMILDARGRIEFINRTIPGVRAEDLLGESVYDLVADSHRVELRRMFASVLRTGRPANMEGPAGGRRGNSAWYRIHAGAVLRDGQAIGLMTISTDITEERRLRDEARAARERIERQAAELTRTVADLNRHVVREHSIQAQLRASRESLRALSARLLSLQEEERRRLSREVHDELGQSLTAIKMEVEALRRSGGSTSNGQRQALGRIDGVIDATIETIRRMARGLRPGALDDLGLAAAVEGLVRDFQERSGIACRLKVPADELDLDVDRATAVFRVLQEALTNVARHAGANRVSVRLDAGNGTVCLTVRDNGRGITAGEIENGNSLGLIGMRERVRLCGGRLALTGRSGSGTILRVRIPFAAETPGAAARGSFVRREDA